MKRLEDVMIMKYKDKGKQMYKNAVVGKNVVFLKTEFANIIIESIADRLNISFADVFVMMLKNDYFISLLDKGISELLDVDMEDAVKRLLKLLFNKNMDKEKMFLS